MPHAVHILGYADTLAGGGVEHALLRLARDWLAAGRRVTLAMGDVHGPLAAALPPGTTTLTARRGALARVVRATAPDLIFCPGSHYTSAAAVAKLRLGRACPPIVAKVSNAPMRGDHGRLVHAAHASWLRLQPYFIDRFVAMTPATATDFARVARVPEARLAVIPNPPTLPSRGAAPFADNGRFILGVGRLAAQKRWDRLIAALPSLADPAVTLVLLGDGPMRGALAAQARALGVAARVHFAGHVTDPFPAMAAARVLALTSDYEGVPSVLREALSVGTPVVATDSSAAIREIVTAATLGTVVIRDDPAALIAALDRWLAPDAKRPAPVAPPGTDAAARYLALFDSLMA